MEGFNREEWGLHPVAVETWEGFLFINLAPEEDREPLTTQNARLLKSPYTSYHLEQLKLAKRVTYTVEANWKILWEGTVECYHCAIVHPDLLPLLPQARTGVGPSYSQYAAAEPGFQLADGVSTLTMNGRSNRPPLRGLDERDRRRYYFVTAYPNFFNLNLLPQTHDLVVKNGVRTLSMLNVPPGRYQIRVGASEATGKAVGTVPYDVEVPDYAKTPFALSGILITSSSASAYPSR